VYVSDNATLEDVTRSLVSEGIAFSQGADRQLALLTKSDWRHADRFDTDLMAAHVRRIVQAFGPTPERGLWVAVEMTWTLAPDIDEASVVAWESRWNQLIEGMPIVLLCMYDRERFQPSLLKHQVCTHPLVVHREGVHPSTFYEPRPATSRRDDVDLDRMLDVVRASSRPPSWPSTAA
jgi:hypothetical protein